MKFFFKKHLQLIILSLILILLSIYWEELFFISLLIYGLFIKLLLSDYINGKKQKILAVTIWATFLILFGLTIYVNNNLPHGPSYSTGEYVCQNDGRGPCGEEFKEDMRELNIPDWAKFLRSSGGWLLIMGLFGAGIIVSNKGEKEYE